MIAKDATREYVSDASALPAVNQRVQLVLDPDDTEAEAMGVPTRIEDVVHIRGKKPSTEILVATPRYTGDVVLPRAGQALSLVWSTERGVLELPVEYVISERVGDVASAWRVRMTGRAVRVQRRHFVRVPCVIPVEVHLVEEVFEEFAEADPGSADPGSADPSVDPGSADPAMLPGHTTDLSEGGMLCALPRPIGAESLVRLAFTFDGESFDHEARVVRSSPRKELPGYRGEPRWNVALRFVDPEAYGDALRKGIFAEQIRLRRTGGR